jgi:hypothetical protein
MARLSRMPARVSTMQDRARSAQRIADCDARAPTSALPSHGLTASVVNLSCGDARSRPTTMTPRLGKIFTLSKNRRRSLRRLSTPVKSDIWGTRTICGNERGTADAVAEGAGRGDHRFSHFVAAVACLVFLICSLRRERLSGP